MTKYRKAFETWRRQYLARELKHARGSVAHMAAYLGLNRQHAYELLEEAGLRKKGREYRDKREGNEAWQSLGDEARH